MDIFDILLLAVAVSMDATAVGMTDGMADPKMPIKKVLLIAAFFGLFQAAMPLVGYFVTKLVAGAFLSSFQKASSWVSFVLLALLGGKMIFDCVREMRSKKRGEAPETALVRAVRGKACPSGGGDVYRRPGDRRYPADGGAFRGGAVSARRLGGVYHRRGDVCAGRARGLHRKADRRQAGGQSGTDRRNRPRRNRRKTSAGRNTIKNTRKGERDV